MFAFSASVQSLFSFGGHFSGRVVSRSGNHGRHPVVLFICLLVHQEDTSVVIYTQSVYYLCWVPVRITVPVFLPVFHPRTGILHRYTGVHNVAVICSLSLLISMATVKSLTSTPGLEGSLLRCQGHIGRSDRQRLRVLSVFLFLKPKCLHMLALPLSFLTTINSSSSRAAIFVRERQREREFCPLSGFRYTGTLRPVPVYRTEATRIGALGITAAYRQRSIVLFAVYLVGLRGQYLVRRFAVWSKVGPLVCLGGWSIFSCSLGLSSGPPGGRPRARLKAGTPREAPTPAPTASHRPHNSDPTPYEGQNNAESTNLQNHRRGRKS